MRVSKSSAIRFLSLFCVSTAASIAFAIEKLPAPFRLIPEPVHVELRKGSGLAYKVLRAVNLKGDAKRPVMGAILSNLIEVGKENEGVLVLSLTKTSKVPESSEGYVLTIYDDRVEISARGDAGLFYGCQSLEQLLEDSRDTGTPIPACTIIDYPALSYRAVHFDVKHHLDHMDYYYDSVDRLARYKINAIVFEFEDKLQYRRQPLVGAPQAISIEDMAALTRYARERHIEITPLVQGLGHATFILKHPEYAHLRELEDNRWAFCPMDEGTYDVLFDMYLDAMDATPGSRYLHVGGDEVGNIGLCHRCKDVAEKEGLLALNLTWLNRVCEFVGKQDRIPIFWDDMPFKYAGLWESVQRGRNHTEAETAEMWKKGLPELKKMMDKFPKNAIYMRWNYRSTRNSGSLRALEWYRDSRLKVMIATAAHTAKELMPAVDRVNYIKEFNELATDYGIEGSLSTAWDDSSPLMELYWRGFIASAEYSWSPNRRAMGDFEKAYLQREFGRECAPFSSIYADLHQSADFWARAFFPQGTRRSRQNALLALPSLEHWIRPGERKKEKPTNFKERLISLPDLKHPGAWSKKYEKRLAEARLGVERHERIAQQLQRLLKISRRNRYHWEVLNAINDFQVMTPRLLLALKQCDTLDKERQKRGTEEVLNVLSEFNATWENLKTIYSKIRFISYPDDYVKDRYFHFASQREDLSFMIQAEELFHKMIREWMKDKSG